jgi:ABC-type multidrug transport system fused ATPase/permease subunit
MNLLKKFLYVFSDKKRQLAALLFVFIFTSILEAFGISMVGVFLNVASQPSLITEKPIIFKLYEYINFQNTDQFILTLGVFIVIIFLVKSILFFAGKVYTYSTLYGNRAAIQERLFKSYMMAPYEFHIKGNSADFINKISSETFQFVSLFSLSLIELISHSVIVFTLVILMTITSKILFLLSLLVIVPTILVFVVLSKRIKTWGKTASISRQSTVKTIAQGLGGLKETRVIGCENYFLQELNKSVTQQARIETLFQSSQFIPRTLVETLLVVTIIGFVCLSQVFLKQDFQSSVSVMGVFALASFRLVPATSQLVKCLARTRNSSYVLDILYLDLKEIGERTSLSKAATYSKEIPASHLSSSYGENLIFEHYLELKDIVYRYPNAAELSLAGVSMNIKRGESIGIIGKSGAGKTTLVDVLLALLNPESGNILVDGQSIYGKLLGWKQLVGYIPQSIFLMDDTIEHNIAFGVSDNQIDLNRLWGAIKSAQLEELVNDLPDGIQTSVGERGVRLSGGQRQRIGIARALYHQREILILDEATSALDNETEKLISESIRALAGSKTLIIIAHRLTTIEHCDRIYALEKGKIVRQGKYQDVISGGV